MRYFIHLAYRGAPFHGWQSQPNAVSVQSEIERALATVFRTPIPIVGAGRTDTGVNARTMYAHADFPDDADPARYLQSLNRLIGHDIALYEFIPVKPDAHARFDATAREYRYFVSDHKSPFNYPLTWQSPHLLDYQAMNEAAALLLDIEDFTSFSKLHTDAKTNICNVMRAEWIPDGDGMVFIIKADRFLRNMVRAVVGTLVEVGRHRIDIDGFQRIIEAKDRCAAGTSMPGHPLFLWDIEYPWPEIKSLLLNNL